MKKLLLFFTSVVCVLAFTASNAPAGEETTVKPKILIAYYSWSGNTKTVAELIAKQTGGDVFEIRTVQKYPEAYRATTEQAKKEINEGFRPELAALVENMQEYDTVFIGSPNWWGTIAPAVSSFLEKHDLSGKKIIPVITHGGGGVQNTVKDLSAQCKGCKINPDAWVGYGNKTSGIPEWLARSGFSG